MEKELTKYMEGCDSKLKASRLKPQVSNSKLQVSNYEVKAKYLAHPHLSGSPKERTATTKLQAPSLKFKAQNKLQRS